MEEYKTDLPRKKVRAPNYAPQQSREREHDDRMTHVKNAKLLRKEIPE